MRIVCVEDDPVYRTALTGELTKNHHLVEDFSNAIEAQNYVRSHEPDAMLIDYRLVGSPDGLSLAQKLRPVLPAVTLIIHSAFVTNEILLEALNSSVDGFIVKGTTPLQQVAEYVANAVLRRRSWYPQLMRKGVDERAKLHPATRILDWNGSTFKLTQTEYRIVEYFLSQPPNMPVSFRDLALLLYNQAQVSSDVVRSIKTCISRLRSKLSHQKRRPQPIQSVRSTGFFWDVNCQDNSTVLENK